MPSTRIETRAGWIGDRHEALIAAVQRALVDGIRIPEQDRDIRIIEYPAHGFTPPPGRGDSYTVVEIAMFTGRSIEAKRRLYATPPSPASWPPLASPPAISRSSSTMCRAKTGGWAASPPSI